MRATAVIAVTLAGLFLAAAAAARADEEPAVSVSPDTVEVGLGFSGADVTISGTTPEGADVLLVVDGPSDTVKMRKQGKVMGVFWMTVEQAKVEDMPSFHLVRGSKAIDELLSTDALAQLGVDPAASQIMDEAQAVDTVDGSSLPEEKATEFVTALRDEYIANGQYTSWRCYHEAEAADCGAGSPTGALIPIDEEGRWETSLSLPANIALGDYSAQVHYVRDGQVVGSGGTTFSVAKVGMVDSLWTMAQDNAPLYGAISLAIAIAMGLTIGFVFGSRGGH